MSGQDTYLTPKFDVLQPFPVLSVSEWFSQQSLVIWVFWAGHGHIFVFGCHFRHLADMCL